MDVKHSLADLKTTAERDPRSPASHMLARGRIEGDTVVLDEPAQREIRRMLRPRRLWIYTITHLQLTASLHPKGFVDFILSRGKIKNGTVVLNEAAHRELREKFLMPNGEASFPPSRPLSPPRSPAPPVPTLAALATNFTHAMAGWAGAGFKVVHRKEYERRHAICLACEHWEPDARLGLGRCKRCACSRFKLWLATSKCPDKPPRW